MNPESNDKKRYTRSDSMIGVGIAIGAGILDLFWQVYVPRRCSRRIDINAPILV